MVKDRLSIAAAALAVALAAGGCTDDPLESGLDPNLREPEACVPAGTPCAVAFVYPLHWGDESVELRGDFGGQATWQAGSPLQIDGGQWRVELARPEGTAIQYKFLVNGASWVNDPANSQTEPDGKGSVNSVVPVRRQRQVCATTPGGGGAGGGGGGGVGGGGGGAGGGPVVPPGAFDWRSAVLYFAFVDRFNNGDKSNDKAVSGVEVQANYQGGDFAGVLQKIEEGYFDKLGVNAIWLNVPIDNPNAKGLGTDGHMYSAYHGYWPSNLDAAEEHFGDLALIKKLVLTAHDRGIKILFDYAMNHMHEEAPIYAEHPEWFWPLDYNGKSCICGEGCDWNNEYEQKRCWFRDYLPDWNFTVDAARAYSVGNAIAWIKKTGCDGYRLDAVKHIEMQWITDLRQRVTAEIEKDTGQHFYMVGETFEAGNRDIIKKFVGPDLLDGQFDFPLRAVLAEILLRRQGSMQDLDGFLAVNDGYYPGVMSTFIGNHDVGRVIHVAADPPWDQWSKGDPWNYAPPLPDYAAPFERLAVAFTFLMTTKGIPLIYYGDEIGLPGAGDPDNRRFMPWEGYSQHQLKLRGHIEKLGAIRRGHAALWRGSRTTVSVSGDTYAYAMSDGEETLYVVLNRGDQAGAVDHMPAKGHDLLGGGNIAGPKLNLPPRSAMIVVPD